MCVSFTENKFQEGMLYVNGRFTKNLTDSEMQELEGYVVSNKKYVPNPIIYTYNNIYSIEKTRAIP